MTHRPNSPSKNVATPLERTRGDLGRSRLYAIGSYLISSMGAGALVVASAYAAHDGLEHNPQGTTADVFWAAGSAVIAMLGLGSGIYNGQQAAAASHDIRQLEA